MWPLNNMLKYLLLAAHEIQYNLNPSFSNQFTNGFWQSFWKTNKQTLFPFFYVSTSNVLMSHLFCHKSCICIWLTAGQRSTNLDFATTSFKHVMNSLRLIKFTTCSCYHRGLTIHLQASSIPLNIVKKDDLHLADPELDPLDRQEAICVLPARQLSSRTMADFSFCWTAPTCWIRLFGDFWKLQETVSGHGKGELLIG